MRLLVSKHNLGKWAAYFIYKKIQEFKPTESNPFVLGLPTGSTPLEMYHELVKLYKKKLISFKHVVTFNMDEYVGLAEDHAQSYHNYMKNNFFRHIDIKPENTHILNGNATYLDYECKVFEDNIAALGGINLLIAGIGEDGHIAFNEPGSSLSSTTRVKTLNYSSILANSRFFNHSIENTPKLVLTMGIQTILDAQEVVVLAHGLKKSVAVAQAIEGCVSSISPATALQFHKKALVLCDDYAAYDLKLKTIRYSQDLQDEYQDLENELSNGGYTN